MVDKTDKIFNVLLVIGMLISLFLIYEHFSSAADGLCSFGESLDCGIVNKSPYANVDGLFYLIVIDYGFSFPLINISDINPFFDLITTNAFLGLLMLLFLLLLNTKYKSEKSIKWIRGLLIFSFLYALFLFYIQHSILQTYCIFCLALDIVIVLSLIISFRIK